MSTTQVISVKATIETPRVPNFLKQASGQWLPLCAIDESGLKAIAEAWTADLLARAEYQARHADEFYSKAGNPSQSDQWSGSHNEGDT